MAFINTPTGPVYVADKSDKPIEATREATDLSTKTVCLVDTGLALHLAPVLAKSFGQVLYYLPDSDSYKKTDRSQIGTGIEGVHQITDLWSHVQVDASNREIDLFIFPDCSFASEALHLKSLGYRVVSAFRSDLMETDKLLFYETLKAAGLPVAPFEVITGIEPLREHLKGVKGARYIKLRDQKYRGVTETFCCHDAEAIDPVLDEISSIVGQHDDEIQFIVQEPIESCCEIGMDTFNLNGQYADNGLVGIEGKDEWYICKVAPSVPAVMKDSMEKVAGFFAMSGYQGLYSTENRITENGESYFIDATCRMPSPPGELMPEMYAPGCYAQAMWDIGGGDLPVLVPSAKFGVELILTSEWYGKGKWLKVDYPPEIADFVKLKNYCVKDGATWVVPNDNDRYIGAVVGTGNTLEQAAKNATKYAEQVKAHKLNYECDVLAEAQCAIEEAGKHGIIF